MALLNWILLIALVVALAHVEQPTQSFTNGVLVFTNTTCARMMSSWETLMTRAKFVDEQLLAWEHKVAETIISYAAVPEQAFRQALKSLGSNRIVDALCN